MNSHTGKLHGKVAIVTGAASGIGEAIAALYLSEGACVVVSDLPERGLTKRFSNHPQVRAVEIDVTADDAPKQIIETATREFGGLDILVNNAGIALGKQFEETTDEEFDRIMQEPPVPHDAFEIEGPIFYYYPILKPLRPLWHLVSGWLGRKGVTR